jgi:hypothetical protein
MSLTHAS